MGRVTSRMDETDKAYGDDHPREEEGDVQRRAGHSAMVEGGGDVVTLRFEEKGASHVTNCVTIVS